MNISIHGDGIKISEALDSYTRSKVDKLDRYLPNYLPGWRRTRHYSHASRRQPRHRPDHRPARARRHLAGGRKTEHRESRYDSLRHQQGGGQTASPDRPLKSKRKAKNQKVRDKYRATVAELDLAEDVPEYAVAALEEAPAAAEILRRKQVEMMPMNEEEAIEQLELLDHNFYMFFNADSEQFNLLYRRDSGGYGILIPQ